LFRKTKMNLMTEEQIEKSKVIGAFDKFITFSSNTQYHSSYDWLMPIAKKLVEGYPHGKKFFDKQREYECDIVNALKKFDIEALFDACYNFITLINQINQK